MYNISQCHSYCSSINVSNTHQKIIPSSRDCCRKGQKNERQGSRLEHTYAYIYKVIETTGLCLIISFIHASGKVETRRCQANGRSWDKMATKGAGKRNQAEQGKWGQGEETMSEWVQPKTLRVKKKYKCKAETSGSRGVQERPVRCFDSSILRQELHTLRHLTHPWQAPCHGPNDTNWNARAPYLYGLCTILITLVVLALGRLSPQGWLPSSGPVKITGVSLGSPFSL